jgi:Ca2+-binding RTX toxin-like protein
VALALFVVIGGLKSIEPAKAAVAPNGQGLTITAGDLKFILRQIKIAEHHTATLTPDNPCGTLVGPGPDQIPDRLTAYGLRTVDGSCNNLFPGRERFAAADEPFPRLTKPVFRDAENSIFGPPGPTSYAQKLGNVFDPGPRVASNLIVDQTSTNPSAVAAAGFPVRTQGNPGLFPCTTDPDPLANPPVEGVPADCVPSHHTLFIPNVTTDVGLSPPYNSLFTFFGQFFDHGVDQTVKSGSSVFVPLHADDPLIAGPDHVLGNADDLPASQRFMVLTRAQNQPGPDGILGDDPATPADESADDIHDANNTDSPWVDQSQTYTSHSSHQVFLREYVLNGSNRPVDTGKLLGGLPGNGASGMATWASVKEQAASKLGLALVDADATNIPMIAADPYGNFIPGPARGLPQYVTRSGLVEGDLSNPVPVPPNVRYFDTPFLTDIAHNADPSPADLDHNPATPPTRPVPDDDDVASADFANQPPGTYDDEMLDAHFCAGDGRVNENIALTAVHQIFHSEHDRLVDYIKGVLTNDTSPAGVAALAEWKLATGAGGWNGQRLFHAARFVTEMEYQHLVFEEFARKVQPAIRPFHVYHPDVNPAIKAEFAHAVYRFGHSMLDDTVARTNEDPAGAKSDNSLPLLTAFLNPPEYFNGGSAAQLTPEQAAGSIMMGSSDQIGNELDEFVTETLRNNLLGLPLDLATLNMTRAREAGVPPLNQVRRQIFADTNDGQLAPYTSWSDFGQHLKHPESLINFVAAYGTHPSIAGQSTLAGKRAAAKAIIDPTSPPATNPNDIPVDAADFMFGTGAWSDNARGLTTTGLDDVDLWVGGLAEVTDINGGLLGKTFNYVFQTQLELLQEGDRLYYLARTPGLNLRTQLEGNSFAEMIQRNTDGTHSLKADAFATADCRFELKNLKGTPDGFASDGATVADDPTSSCDESKLLLRKPDGTIQYRQINSVDPPGINGQSVYNGTASVDRIFGGNDNDTFWGGDGNDIIDSNAGDDVTLGGDGNDRITDLGGADTLKGGPGNDSIDGGAGDDLILGGDGNDFTNGGANDNETFGGPGTDFINAGQGADAVFGDDGDDWIQGGSGQDLLQGDHAAPFFDDPGETKPGNDVFIGQVGENDYDAEGGDDLMSQNAAVDRNAGAGGFDWAFHQYDTVGADDDMAINNNLPGLPLPVVVNRDRWQETEADSGSAFDDIIKGDDAVPSTVGGGGFTGCDVLDQAGVNRINGLSAILPNLTGSLAAVEAASATGTCPLQGPIWGDGNILLGGAGSDQITGRGGDDIIDGDRSLSVRISVRTNAADPATEIGSTDLMEHQYLRDGTGSLTGPTLQAAVAAGTVDPGNLVIVREIVSPAAGTDGNSVDAAVFAGPRSNYTFTVTSGVITVTQTGANVAGQKVSDGIDTLRNIEQLKFSDQTVDLRPPAAPSNVRATAGVGSASITWTLAPPQGSPVSSQQIVVNSQGAVVRTITGIPSTATSRTITGLTGGRSYTFQVRAVNVAGPGPLSAPSGAVTAMGLPAAPTGLTAVRGNASARLSWTAGPDGGSPITGYVVQVRIAGAVVRTDEFTGPATSVEVTGLTNGTAYTFRVGAVNALGSGPLATSGTVTPATVPGAPGILAPTQGAAGGALTAVANWSAPASTGGSAITGYRVSALPVAADGVTVTGPPVVVSVGAAARTRSFTLPAGTYRFEVVALNALGAGDPSPRSEPISPR